MARNEHYTKPCDDCGEDVIFLRNRNGKLVPVDADTVDENDYQYDPDKHDLHFDTREEM